MSMIAAFTYDAQNIECPSCGGTGMPLGGMNAYRCRHCGDTWIDLAPHEEEREEPEPRGKREDPNW